MLNQLQHSVPGYSARRARGSTQSRTVLCRGAALDTSLFKLPVFLSKSTLFPSSTGELVVYEPRYHAMLQHVNEVAQASGSKPRFGHMLHPKAAPPALLEGGKDGLPRVGCVALIKAQHKQPNGSVVLEYEGARRFKVLSVTKKDDPYTEVYAMNFADVEQGTGPVGEQQLADLEMEVFRGLRDVARLTRRAQARMAEALGLDGTDAAATAGLPEPLLRYAPKARVVKSLGQVLSDRGYGAAGHSVYMWQAQGSVYGKSASRGKRSVDPYELAAGQILGEPLRRELFSFAAAGLLELEQPQLLALLDSQDTLARLQYVQAAVSPYLAELKAKAALTTVLGPSAGSDRL